MLSTLSPDGDATAFRETDLYRKCQDLGIIPKPEADPASRTDGDGVVPESPEPERDRVTEPAGRSEGYGLHLRLKIDGMWCPACAWLIEETLGQTPGVIGATCSFATDRMACSYDPVTTTPALISDTIEYLGYHPIPYGEETDSPVRRKEMLRLIVSAGLTINTMMLSFALYTGFFTDFGPETVKRFSWPIFFMATIVLLYGGHSIFRRAVKSFLRGAHGMETLVSVGVWSAYLYSVVSLFTGSLHLYFDTASMLVTLVLLGKMLENGAKRSIHSDLDHLTSLQPSKARVYTRQFPGGRYVTARQLRPGDLFISEASEIIPADGRVLDGTGHVDESSLSGEARPLPKGSGDIIRSGTRVVDGCFRVEATATSDDSSLGQMIRIVERALADRTPLEGKTHQTLRWFVPLIILLAAGTAVVCICLDLSTEAAMIRAMTVLVIACPCALGMAIPLARVAGISMANRHGILVRNFEAFERTREVKAIVFDKTGTITRGQWELLDIALTGSLSEDYLLTLARAMERDIHHPVAVAIRKRADGLPDCPIPLSDIQRLENGISARAGTDLVKIGARAFLAAEISGSGHLLGSVGSPSSQKLVDEAHSVVYMSYGGEICGVFSFGDSTAPDAQATLNELKGMGIRLAIVSGDRHSTTQVIGHGLGITDAHGDMSPQGKAARVRATQQKGNRVAMVGDGINDAPALAQADLAIAVHTGSGSGLGKETSDITLMRGELKQILRFWELARVVNRKVHQNLVWAFLYNIASLPMAMAGLLTPLIAVSAMLLSSLSVLANTLRLTRKTF